MSGNHTFGNHGDLLVDKMRTQPEFDVDGLDWEAHPGLDLACFHFQDALLRIQINSLPNSTSPARKDMNKSIRHLSMHLLRGVASFVLSCALILYDLLTVGFLVGPRLCEAMAKRCWQVPGRRCMYRVRAVRPRTPYSVCPRRPCRRSGNLNPCTRFRHGSAAHEPARV